MNKPFEINRILIALLKKAWVVVLAAIVAFCLSYFIFAKNHTMYTAQITFENCSFGIENGVRIDNPKGSLRSAYVYAGRVMTNADLSTALAEQAQLPFSQEEILNALDSTVIEDTPQFIVTVTTANLETTQTLAENIAVYLPLTYSHPQRSDVFAVTAPVYDQIFYSAKQTALHAALLGALFTAILLVGYFLFFYKKEN
ncbi:MAG: hypothetical protein PHG02_03645 [Oscillospiraceae bacterium]|nr:hypothetical protein [Oscillospiraceae bacterium]